MGTIAESEIADRFNQMFQHFGASDGDRFELLHEDIGQLAMVVTDEMNISDLLGRAGRAAGAGLHEYMSVSRVFTEMADAVIFEASRSAGDTRADLQSDAFTLLTYAYSAIPQGQHCRVDPVHARPLMETAGRLLATEPEEVITACVSMTRQQLKLRMEMPVKPPVAPAASAITPALEGMVSAARASLHRYAH